MRNMNDNMELDLETPEIRCANIITMENATCSGACCVNRSADEQQLLKHSRYKQFLVSSYFQHPVTFY